MSALWDELSRYMAREGIKNRYQLARLCGIPATQFNLDRAIVRGGDVHPDTLRKLSEGTGIPLGHLIVASGMWTAEELGAAGDAFGDARTLTNDELLRLVRERMRSDFSAPAGEPDLDDYEPGVIESDADVPTGRRRPRLLRDEDPQAANGRPSS